MKNMSLQKGIWSNHRLHKGSMSLALLGKPHVVLPVPVPLCGYYLRLNSQLCVWLCVHCNNVLHIIGVCISLVIVGLYIQRVVLTVCWC